MNSHKQKTYMDLHLNYQMNQLIPVRFKTVQKFPLGAPDS